MPDIDPWRISVAPMMDCTDRHCRYFLRLLSPHVRLYSEMVTAAAIVHGDPDRLLRFSPVEHPLALQLGGSDPGLLAAAVRKAEPYGYDEINLNVGCPSARVSEGSFGACLMAYPGLVARCVQAMQAATHLPVTVKTRIGIDDRDDYGFLCAILLPALQQPDAGLLSCMRARPCSADCRRRRTGRFRLCCMRPSTGSRRIFRHCALS